MMPSKDQSKSQKPKQSQNRPTDSFGGPPRGRNTISLTVALAALAFFVLLQWSKGDINKWFSSAATVLATQAPIVHVEVDDETPVAQATVKATPTPKANSANQARVTAAPQPNQTAKALNTSQPRPTKTPRPTALPSPTANAPPVAHVSNLPAVSYGDLPPEAQETVGLIDVGGPFPYSRDGVVFQNRERILPRQADGYYHEYTVITPGESDRGARRIIKGQEGEMYYTDDHYASFREIMR